MRTAVIVALLALLALTVRIGLRDTRPTLLLPIQPVVVQPMDELAVHLKTVKPLAD